MEVQYETAEIDGMYADDFGRRKSVSGSKGRSCITRLTSLAVTMQKSAARVRRAQMLSFSPFATL